MEIYWTEFEEPITWPFFLVWFGGSEQIPTNQSHQKKLNRLGYLLMSLWKLSLAFGIIVVQSTDSQCHFKCSTSPLAHLTRPNMSEYSPFPSFPAMAETCAETPSHPPFVLAHCRPHGRSRQASTVHPLWLLRHTLQRGACGDIKNLAGCMDGFVPESTVKSTCWPISS